MRSQYLYYPIAILSLAALPFFAGATVREADQGASAFLADTGRAMETMDAGMMAKPSGEVDHDFVQMMVPHHQGAIDMAIAEIRYGHDERLKRIAQEIIVDQQQEIAAMHLALSQKLPPSVAAPTQPGDRSNHVGMPAGQEH